MLHQLRPPVLKLFPGEDGLKHRKSSMKCLFDQLVCDIPDDISKRVGAKSRWIKQMGEGILSHAPVHR